MIKYVSGDILLSKAAVIAHGVAANDPMDQGLAKALHERYPNMHKDFHHWCHLNHPKSGEVWLWGGVGGARIANLITQEGGYGHGGKPGKATTAAVNGALRVLKKVVEQEGFASVALPKLATGVGGLEWDEVLPLIEKQLSELNATVYVYSTYVPGAAAKE